MGTSIAVIGLYIAFALPIILRIRAGDRFEHGAWSLGKHYKWISPISVAWIALVCVLFLLPVSPERHPGRRGLRLGGGQLRAAHRGRRRCCCSAAGTCCRRGNWFTGPVREAGTEAELAEIERELEGR